MFPTSPSAGSITIPSDATFWMPKPEDIAEDGIGLEGLTAGELMTPPAITIHPDATIPAAAKLMNQHHIRGLPVMLQLFNGQVPRA